MAIHTRKKVSNSPVPTVTAKPVNPTINSSSCNSQTLPSNNFNKPAMAPSKQMPIRNVNPKEMFAAPMVAPVQGVSKGGKTGIIIGIVLFLIILFLVYFFVIKKKSSSF